MLKKRHKYDDRIFGAIVLSFKKYTYQNFKSLPERQQLDVDDLPENSTLEIAVEFFPNDGALGVTIAQFFWVEAAGHSSSIESMHVLYHPLPHKNSSLIYSGHCMTEFFYVLPNNQITDDIFIRNEFAESTLIETAKWFETTGLTDIEERNLPKYIRAEYGHLLTDEDGLKADDLTFMGCFKFNQNVNKKLHLNINTHSKQIYIWHYHHDHYAYAYYDDQQILQYSLGTHYPEKYLCPLN